MGKPLKLPDILFANKMGQGFRKDGEKLHGRRGLSECGVGDAVEVVLHVFLGEGDMEEVCILGMT